MGPSQSPFTGSLCDSSPAHRCQRPSQPRSLAAGIQQAYSRVCWVACGSTTWPQLSGRLLLDESLFPPATALPFRLVQILPAVEDEGRFSDTCSGNSGLLFGFCSCSALTSVFLMVFLSQKLYFGKIQMFAVASSFSFLLPSPPLILPLWWLCSD